LRFRDKAMDRLTEIDGVSTLECAEWNRSDFHNRSDDAHGAAIKGPLLYRPYVRFLDNKKDLMHCARI